VDEVLHCYRHPDRETRVSCSECGRGVCPDCMVYAPVGIRCLEHASQGKPKGPATAQRTVRTARSGFLGQDGIVTKILIALNVGIFLINLLQGASLNSNGGSLFADWALFGPVVAQGDWWRLITAAFLHGGIVHLGLNMLFLWIVGLPVESAIGKWRFLAVYLISALAGSAGALLLSPTAVTVGASGALYGILGVAVVLEQQGSHVLGGSALGLVIVNFVLSLAIPGVSIGGHAGGFVGGVLCGLVLTNFGRGHATYGRLGVQGIVGLAAVGVASLLVAYFKVRGYT